MSGPDNLHARLGLSPARLKAKELLNALSPDLRAAVLRESLWRVGFASSAWRVAQRDIPIVGPGGLSSLHTLDIEEMWPLILSHSDYARIRDRFVAEGMHYEKEHGLSS